MENSPNKILEIMESKINQMELENEKLKERLAIYDGILDYKWLLHSEISLEENYGKPEEGGLPLPRLEMRFETRHRILVVTYGIAREHFIDGFEFIPLGQTTVECNVSLRIEQIKNAIIKKDIDAINLYLPFRDGIHLKYDSITFNIPIYVRCYDSVCELKLNKEDKAILNSRKK